MGVLLAACSEDEMAIASPQENVAITFESQMEEDGNYKTYKTYGTYKTYETYRAPNGHTGTIDDENHELYYTGFGVFASQHTGSAPDLMYNQQVEYTFPTEVVAKGYWSYSPLKYWPADVSDTYLCAYAPYVATPTAAMAEDSEATGIVGMAGNASATPYILYRRCLHPEENVDLLWSYFRPTQRTVAAMQMHHALARLRVNITLDDASTTTKKVLLRRITLTGSMAETARLNLTGHTLSGGYLIPTWTNHSMEDRTVVIDHNPETTPASYGILAEEVRYIDDLPYKWQPAGLQKDVKTNVLCMGDYPSFVYLIPQSALSLQCSVQYALMASDGTLTTGSKTHDTPIAVASPLNGNTTYDLNLQIRIDD